MNFIGVELAGTRQSSVPNGANVLQPDSNRSDFKTVLQKTEEADSEAYLEDSRGNSTADTLEQKRSSDVLEKNSESQGGRKEAVKKSDSRETKSDTVSEGNSKAGAEKAGGSRGSDEDSREADIRTGKNRTLQSSDSKTAKRILSSLRQKSSDTSDIAEKLRENTDPELNMQQIAELIEADAEGAGSEESLLALEELGIPREELIQLIMERAQKESSGEETLSVSAADADQPAKTGIAKLLQLLKGGKKDLEKSAAAEKAAGPENKRDTEVSVKVIDLRTAVKEESVPSLELADASEKLELDTLENGGADGKGRQLFSDILEQRDIFSRDRSHVSAAESTRFRQFMKEQGNADIVRDAKFILKDEATGEIKLILKPERLGEVRIQLSLEDNRIAGRIIVENNNIRAYFEENMADLLEEFRENGFEHAGLDVSVRQDSGRRHKGQERHISQSAAASVFNEHVPDSGYAEIDSLINLVV